MRLAILVVSIITLILVSRWYTLTSEKDQGEALNTQTNSSALAEDADVEDSPIAPEAGSGPTDSVMFARFREKGQIRDQSLASSNSASSAKLLGTNARNVQQLVRAEYLLPKEEAAKLMGLNPGVVLEIEQVESEVSDQVRLQVTANAKTQVAFSNFLGAIYPSQASVVVDFGSLKEPVDIELAAQ